MGCYVVPLIATVAHYSLRKKKPSLNTPNARVLNTLFLGASVFGIVDHAWNGELLFRGENLFLDLLLGFTITAVIFLVWGVMELAKTHFLSDLRKKCQH